MRPGGQVAVRRASEAAAISLTRPAGPAGADVSLAASADAAGGGGRMS